MKHLKLYEDIDNKKYYQRIRLNSFSDECNLEHIVLFNKEEIKKFDEIFANHNWEWIKTGIFYNDHDGMVLSNDIYEVLLVDSAVLPGTSVSITFTDGKKEIHNANSMSIKSHIILEYWMISVIFNGFTLYINKGYDEWYFVYIEKWPTSTTTRSNEDGSKYELWKCDQFDGLIEFLKDKNYLK